MSRYKTYDPSKEGYGSRAQWQEAAEALARGMGTFRRVAGAKSSERVDPALVTLGLTDLPETVAELKRAMRNAMMVAHPDHGGTDDAARAVLDAFKALLVNYAE
jgi:hypothetical protein